MDDDDVLFSHNALCGMLHWQCQCERRAGAGSYKFPTYSPEGVTLSQFVVIYNGSRLCTRDISYVDIWGCCYLLVDWPAVTAECSGSKVCSL